MGSFILYLSICAGAANCHWTYAGTYHPSDSIVVETDANDRRTKRVEATALVMCERAAKRMQLKTGEWLCQPSGMQR